MRRPPSGPGLLRRVSGGVVAAGMVALLIGCASGTGLERFQDQPIAVYAAHTSAEAGQMAEIRGVLTLDGGCLTLVDEYDASGVAVEAITVPMFPSHLDPGLHGESLHLGDDVFALGERFSWRGGYTETVDASRASASQDRFIPDACAGDLELALVEGLD